MLRALILMRNDMSKEKQTLWIVVCRFNGEVIYQSFTSQVRAIMEMDRLEKDGMNPTLHIKETN